MKKLLTYLSLPCFFIFIFSCKKEVDPNAQLRSEKGFSLYWHHDTFSQKGRGLLFDFTNNQRLTHDYDLQFGYTIKNKVITVKLLKATDNGECAKFPGWGNENLCESNGNIYIPDSQLPAGAYDFEFIAHSVKVSAKLDVSAEKVSLTVPSNPYFTNNIPAVYPIPIGLVFGSIVYSGSEKETIVTAMIDELSALGLKPATVPDYPYRYLDVKQNTHLQKGFWEPDNHSVSLLYTRNNVNFKSVFEVMKKNFELSGNALNIGLYSSNGDEAHASAEGTTVFYAE